MVTVDQKKHQLPGIRRKNKGTCHSHNKLNQSVKKILGQASLNAGARRDTVTSISSVTKKELVSFFKRNIFQQFNLQFNLLGAFVSLIWTTFKNIGQDVAELFRPHRFGTKTEPKFVPKIYCKRGCAAGYL